MTADATTLSLTLNGYADGVVKTAAHYEVLELTSDKADLEQVFFDYYRGAGDAAA